ncbi:MAG: L-serine ammonia-lyase, iron-sulfur-dependent, subunit alpha, partial [Deltaproteobacteria bacterium]|nr:L-serine ammonia-lyase, iron-sulfur-dependent, subunit alpha [Deltaproteobacteria bacterium]
MKNMPSIFNDVIGPVMRGPSSSHCAAGVRIGLMARDLMDGKIQDVLIEFDPDGSLATTHDSQGSDMGLFGGLLGWDAADDRLADSLKGIQEAGIKVDIKITPLEFDHPNTYRMTVTTAGETHTLTAISIGGGIIEVVEIDGVKVSMLGDYYETLIYFNGDGDRLLKHLKERIRADEIRILQGKDTRFIEIKAQGFLDKATIDSLRSQSDIQIIKQIAPVLPILSRKEIQVPFITCSEMLAYNSDKNLDLWELAVHYESQRGGITHDRVMQKMEDIIDIMQVSIDTGLAGTEYADRILGYQSGGFQTRMENHDLIDAGVLNRIIWYTTALMESKSAMGLIVAAPTAGACGGLPGACIGVARGAGLSNDDIARAMLAGGIIGVFIAAHASFAAKVGGCQAECGAGSGMAAAALVTLAGGSTQQAVNAASMALQNILGMICDPVANRVEVPCLGKNVMAAS